MTTSCAETLDIPPAPEFDDVLAAYANPTAEVTAAVMEAVGDELLALRAQLEDSEVFDEILDVIVKVQVELDENTDENGNLVIPGLGAVPDPNAVIEINHNCPGWDPSLADNNAETSGSVELTMVLEVGNIRPVVWGEAMQCQFLATVGQRALQSKYDGGVAVHFGEGPVSTSEPLRNLEITFVLLGTLEVEGKELPIRRSFRLRDGAVLEILWELANGTNFVYLFNLETLGQGIRDANGTLACDLEERQCTLPSGSSFSW
jgi:hypothetical protein